MGWFSNGALELQNGKARDKSPGLHIEAEGGSTMELIAKFAFAFKKVWAITITLTCRKVR
jgi:hypothetical protein